MHPAWAVDRTSVDVPAYLRPAAVGRGIGSRLYDVLLAIIDAADVHRAKRRGRATQ
ncbi:MAG: hypothetical protein ACR2F6_00345 [Mycobacteriales bacterium]